MHRVELKVKNNPYRSFYGQVPNAPCGVESNLICRESQALGEFLMHRVELKAFLVFKSGRDGTLPVPNAPCGVESAACACLLVCWAWFLMHRVELKVGGLGLLRPCCLCS